MVKQVDYAGRGEGGWMYLEKVEIGDGTLGGRGPYIQQGKSDL